MSGVLRRLQGLALTLGAIGGSACIVFALICLTFGLTPLVVQSGSMEPTVATGSLLVTKTTPARDLRRGDVVTVKRHDRTLVTHRVVNLTLRGDTATLQLKGDANKVVDPEAYVVKKAGRKMFAVPYLGYLAAWASSRIGLFLLGIYVAFLALVVATDRRGRDRSHDPGPVKGGKRKAARRATSTLGASAILASAMALPVTLPRGTLAAWTDAAAVGTSTLTAYTVPAPVVSCGTLSIGTTRLNWTAVSGATSYTLSYGAGGGTTETVPSSTTSKTFSGLITSGVFSVKANINYGSTTWTSVSSNKKNYTVLLIAVGICTDA